MTSGFGPSSSERGFDDRRTRVGDQHLGFAVGQHEGDGFGVEAGVEGVEHGADHRHAEVGLEHGRHVGQHHGHRVALADATAGERVARRQRS
jgi:hypothetical protein